MSALGRWSFFLAIAVGCLLLPACTHVCTLVGGENGLIIDVEVIGGKLPAGGYTIVARVQDVELRLDETLSEVGGVMVPTRPPDAVVDGKHLFLAGAVAAQLGRITVGFREGPGPADATIEVWRGAAMIGQETYAPTYTEYRPNGDDCPPELQQARDKLVLVAPST